MAAKSFDERVDRTGECHLWTGSVTAQRVAQLRVDGRLRTAHQVAWEREHGALRDGQRVVRCTIDPLCVRPDHLSIRGEARKTSDRRRDRGSGTVRPLGSGRWKITLDAGRDASGRRQRISRTVHGNKADANRALAALGVEIANGETKARARERLSVAELVEWYRDFAIETRGLAISTVDGYLDAFDTWIRPTIGHIDADRLTPGDIDTVFGAMRAEGLSHSRMSQARSGLSGAYRWGRRHQKVTIDPMRGFEMPRSMAVKRATQAPEVEDLLHLLDAAAEHDPDLLPVLSLAATTGMRRGELSGLRRDRLDLGRGELTVDNAVAEVRGRIHEKPPKTHQMRTVRLDKGTVEMLRSHLEEMDERASQSGTSVAVDAFVFSLEPDCSAPLRPNVMTTHMKRLRKKADLDGANFDANILALRKWTSTELMDAGFNPSAVSGRQGHTVQVMLNHYSQRRASADQAAAEHLGSRIYRRDQGPRLNGGSVRNFVYGRDLKVRRREAVDGKDQRPE